MTRHILIAFALLLSSTAAVLTYASSSNDRDQTISVDVDLVLVNAAVSDSKGRMVTGLQQDNFRIWEDKVEEKVGYFSSEDTPMSIGLIFDATGSMADKISTARDAAASFLRVGNPDDEYFLVTFSQRATLVEPFTTDISRLQNQMLFTQAKGVTPLFDAVYLGLETMKTAKNKRKALLLITDGEAFFPDSVDQLEDICNKIGLELRNQYVLGYHSTNKAKDGRWRKIPLKVKPKGISNLSVHAKNGYYAESLDIKH
jgi:Ca-activated chloride channel homolog